MKKYFTNLVLLFLVGCSSNQYIMNDQSFSGFPNEIKYADAYDGHLQGFASDYKSSLFWSHTTQLVKTDFQGTVIKVVDAPSHHGDLDYFNGKIYVAVNLGRFNEEQGLADSWVYVYNSKDLSFLKKYPIPELIHGAGGIAIHNKKAMIVGGLPGNGEYNKNLVYEYNLDFELIKVHSLETGYTYKGIQICTYYNGYWYFGCYGSSKKSLSPVVLKAKLVDEKLQLLKIYDLDFSHGMIGLVGDKWLVSNKTFSKTARIVEFEE